MYHHSQMIQCPYCHEMIEIGYEPHHATQQLIEDCAVCCRPIHLHLHWHGEQTQVEAKREDD